MAEQPKSATKEIKNTVDQSKQAAKDGANLAKNAASGNYLGAAKDAVNLLKNKKVRTHMLISTLTSILIPILVILLIAGLFMSIVSAIGETVTNVVNAIGRFFAGVGNWFISIFDPDSGKFIIKINEQKFQEIKSQLLAVGVNTDSSNLTDECLKLFLLAQYKTQYPEDVIIKIEISNEEKEKIQKRGRGNTVATEDIDGDGDQEYCVQTSGCIQLYRPEFTNGKLRYTQEETLKQYENGEKTFDNVKGNYSIDASGSLIIPQKTTEKYIKGEDEVESQLLDLSQEDNYDWESFNKRRATTEVVTPSLQKLQYQSVIASYSMPFEFLTILTTFTQNSEYGVAVAELVQNESHIKLNILDNSKTTEERSVYQYNSHSTVKYKVGAKTIIPNVQLWRDYNNNLREYVDESDRKMLWNHQVLYKRETNTPHISRENMITTEYTTSIQIGEAKTWFAKKENSYDVNEVASHLDDSIQNNPQILTPPAHAQFNFTIRDQDNYIGVQNLYDNNQDFKNFIDNYYIRDNQGRNLNDFKNQLVGDSQKEDFRLYADDYVEEYLMKKFYREELGLDYSPGNQTPPTLRPPKDEYYENLCKAINDYKAEDVNWKIDKNSYDVMPYDINNKREQEKVKKAYYASEKNYEVTSAGPAEDNTDAFLNLLVTGSGTNKRYVYYKIEDTAQYKAPGSDLASAPDMLFEILAGNSKTANMENAMRYIMYKMTGIDYGVTDFNSALRSMSAISVGSDYNVTDQSIFITDVNKLKQAIQALGIGGQGEQNLLNNADGFIQMQETYHINAAFAISVTIAESSAGTNWAAIDPSTYNWYSIKGDYRGQSLNGWRKYSSFNEATKDFGNLIANSGYYCPDKNTISQIAPVYCDEAWGDMVRPYMQQLLQAAGIDLSSYSSGGASRSSRICS